MFPSSVHLYLPATLPPGPYPFVYDSAWVWVFCDSAEPAFTFPGTRRNGVPFEVKVTGDAPVGVQWLDASAYRPSDTNWQNLKVFSLNREISPALGTREAVVEITAGGAVATLPVSVTITDGPFITPHDATLALDVTDGSASSALWFPNARTALGFTLAAESSGWLRLGISGGSGYTDFSASTAGGSLPGGEYLSSITVSAPEAVNSPLQIPVRWLHHAGDLLPTPPSLSGTVFITQTAPRQQTLDLAIENTGQDAISFTIESSSGWLSASPTSGVTPAHIAVTVDGTSLPLGTYDGSIYIYSPAAASLAVPVTFTVSAGNFLTLSPSEFNVFTWPGKIVNTLDDRVLRVTSTRPLTAKVDSPDWLEPYTGPFRAQSITTPQDIQLHTNWALLNPNPPAPLPAGKFAGVITISSAEATNSPQTATVNAYSLAAAPLTLSPPYINFSGPTPPPQNVSVTAPVPTAFTVSIPASNTWLAVSPTLATTPATLVFSQKAPRPANAVSPEIVSLYATEPDLPAVPIYFSVFF